jgi:hypothetical protein
MYNASTTPKHVEDIHLAIAKIDSNNPNAVVSGINVLTKKAFEAVDSLAVQFELFPQLIVSLSSLLDTINPLSLVIFEEYDEKLQAAWSQFDESTSPWNTRLISQGNPLIKVQSKSLILCVWFGFLLICATYYLSVSGVVVQLGRQ